MIFLDVTKTAAARHRSGLMRVTSRLQDELGAAATAIQWGQWRAELAVAEDWFLTAEVFADHERPGFRDFVRRHPARKAAIFHDAIPLKLPHVTWPQAVARMPGYLKGLAEFDHVFAVSESSRQELLQFWRWQQVTARAEVSVLPLGSDFDGEPRTRSEGVAPGRGLLAVGIIEPRKNQTLLLEVVVRLWEEGLDFPLHLVGRVNPHFGEPTVRKIKALQRKYSGLCYHRAATDAEVAALYRGVRAALFPTRAEGCGLPLLEALWRGVPCVASDLPVLQENASAGGCVLVPVDDVAAWTEALRRILTDDGGWEELRRQAGARPLPTWTDTARAVQSVLNNRP